MSLQSDHSLSAYAESFVPEFEKNTHFPFNTFVSEFTPKHKPSINIYCKPADIINEYAYYDDSETEGGEAELARQKSSGQKDTYEPSKRKRAAPLIITSPSQSPSSSGPVMKSELSLLSLSTQASDGSNASPRSSTSTPRAQDATGTYAGVKNPKNNTVPRMEEEENCSPLVQASHTKKASPAAPKPMVFSAWKARTQETTTLTTHHSTNTPASVILMNKMAAADIKQSAPWVAYRKIQEENAKRMRPWAARANMLKQTSGIPITMLANPADALDEEDGAAMKQVNKSARTGSPCSLKKIDEEEKSASTALEESISHENKNSLFQKSNNIICDDEKTIDVSDVEEVEKCVVETGVVVEKEAGERETRGEKENKEYNEEVKCDEEEEEEEEIVKGLTQLANVAQEMATEESKNADFVSIPSSPTVPTRVAPKEEKPASPSLIRVFATRISERSPTTSLLSMMSYLGPPSMSRKSEPKAPVVEFTAAVAHHKDAKSDVEPMPLAMMLAYRDSVNQEEGKMVFKTKEVDTVVPKKAEAARVSSIPDKEKSWRSAAAKTQSTKKSTKWENLDKKLVASETSWSVQLAKRKKEAAGDEIPDEQVVRNMKSILNKLTVEKFDGLYEKLINESGISKTNHVEALMREVFDKATTQHHFIDMYTHFCLRLNEWSKLTELGGKEGSFKRILLNQCQASFESDLSPPPELINASVQDEEMFEMQVKYKTKMLGNIKFVGALLKTKILAPRILIVCSQVLMMEYTPETLESLGVLITATGGTFDDPQWGFHNQFCGIMYHIEQLATDKTVPARIRFLLQDVLDLRRRGWDTSSSVLVKSNRRVTVASAADIKAIKCFAKQENYSGAKPIAEESSKNLKRAETLPVKLMKNDRVSETKTKTTLTTSKKVEPAKKEEEPIPTEDVIQILARFHRNCASAFKKVALGGDVTGAVTKLTSLPTQFRACEWANMVSRIAEDSNENSRNKMWLLLEKLTQEWKEEGFDINEAVKTFKEDTYNDLLLDIPHLPVIMTSELQPLLHRLRCDVTL